MILSFLFASLTVHAAPLKKIELTPRQSAAIKEYNRKLSQQPSTFAARPAPLKPFSEVEEAGYLFFSADTNFDSGPGKKIMARNLPDGVTIVIFAETGDDIAEIRRQYQGLIDTARLKIVEISGASRGFWARDGLPVPVWGADNGMELVDARYYHRFEPDDTMANWFHSFLRKHQFYFEGGNFMTNDKGDCITVDNDRSSEIPESLFREQYGCKRVIRLPFEKGIGHVDESVRFLSSNVVVTDSPTYAQTLKGLGFDVRMLPRPDNPYETYVNALLVNGTVFVPVFNERNDQKALDVYRAAGLKVFAIESSSLSNDGLGSIHCITMTYPKVPFQQLMESLGGREL